VSSQFAGEEYGLEIGPLSSPVMYFLSAPIVTIGLSLTVFAVLRVSDLSRTDRQTDRQRDRWKLSS